MITIKDAFYRGLKITIPILITIAIIVWLLKTVEVFFGFIIKLFIPIQYYIPGMGALFGVLLIFLVGVVMYASFVSKLYDYFETLVKKIPGVRLIYQSIQDIMGFMDQGKGNKKGATVLVEVIGDIKVLGFVTREDLESVGIASKEDVCVYCPLSYQIGGFALIVPRSKIRAVAIETQEAMSFILTAGISKEKGKLDAARE